MGRQTVSSMSAVDVTSSGRDSSLATLEQGGSGRSGRSYCFWSNEGLRRLENRDLKQETRVQTLESTAFRGCLSAAMRATRRGQTRRKNAVRQSRRSPDHSRTGGCRHHPAGSIVERTGRLRLAQVSSLGNALLRWPFSQGYRRPAEYDRSHRQQRLE